MEFCGKEVVIAQDVDRITADRVLALSSGMEIDGDTRHYAICVELRNLRRALVVRDVLENRQKYTSKEVQRATDEAVILRRLNHDIEGLVIEAKAFKEANGLS